MISFRAEQVILVTGASSGIGEAVALELNSLGATVIASGRSRERLEANKNRCAHPERFHSEPLDLTADMEALPAWIKDLRQRHGKLSGLAHAAGISRTSPLREYDLASAQAMFDLLFHAAMLLAKGFADRRNNVGQGAAMVFISAASALVPMPSLLIYAAAKGALATAARCMSKELAAQGIRVNCVSPALVKTPMQREYADLLGPDAFAEVERSYPLGLGEPDDVAGAVAYLLSSKAKWITGQNMLLSGGWG
jgi:NAD(P)-dependent dehydrogenase (short-subunit alcohol dehydrogenase family)